MKVDKIEVMNVTGAMRGMRNPMNSWERNDSTEEQIGPNDLELCRKLIKAGPEHRKFMRQLLVSFDVTAPLFWWKEFDTYKVGTTANSTSTMHKLTSRPITIEDFEMDDFVNLKCDVFDLKTYWDKEIEFLEFLRKKYVDIVSNNASDSDIAKKYWKELIRALPESYLQTRTVTMSFENLYSIFHQRKGHKLTEWKTFIDAFKDTKFAQELLFFENNK